MATKGKFHCKTPAKAQVNFRKHQRIVMNRTARRRNNQLMKGASMKLSEITNKDEYEFTHGHLPKGNGYWAFEITGGDGDGAYTKDTIFQYGNFTQARRSAIKVFKSMSGRIKEIIEVKVLP